MTGWREIGYAALVVATAGVVGCGEAPKDPVVTDVRPLIDTTYEVSESSRPLNDAERQEALALLDATPDDFFRRLAEAPPLRQSSMLFVLQQRPAVAREHREEIARLAGEMSDGVVRRAASFTLEAMDETIPAATAP